ncbi:recombinase family protein [Brevundimonas naejangsanensis]|uniref:recombinase family protein n=1 Tax=Brevundimonas naejangsanensis TaxID=588932 RepID=UPI0026F086D0|nr:recombinase family protein [Brevundimonas naejangsanensis]
MAKAHGAIIGYARTSTADQVVGLEAQIAELENIGCSRIFSEQVSSIDADRPQLKAALDYLRDGDTFIVTRPDRLARNTGELLNIVEGLDQRGVVVRILSMDINTSTPTGKLLLTFMAGIATFERELMLERQRAGIAAAKAAGKYKGRQPTARNKADQVLALKAEGVGPSEIAKRLGIGRTSVHRILAAA